MNQELCQLIRQAKQGKKEAFGELVKHFKDPVFRQAFAMTHDRMEAEDISQEAFLKAYCSLDKLNSEFAFAAWLARIVYRLCCDRLQKIKKEEMVMGEGLAESIAVPPSYGGTVENRQLQMDIGEAMQKLSPEHRAAIVLRDVRGFPYDEIAEILGIPPGTVKSRLHAARLLLRAELTR